MYLIKEVMDMPKISRTAMVAITVLLLAVSPVFSDENKPSRSYDDLVNAYMNRSELLPEARDLEAALLSKAENLKPIDLWRSIQDFNKPAKIRAANGLALVLDLFPDGDPGNWDKVKGFWYPQVVSRPLAAFDAIYYTSIALLELDEAGAPWIAQGLFDDLRRSSRAAFLAIRTSPLQYPELASRVESGTGFTPIGDWPDAVLSGSLPFAHAVSSFVTQDQAMMLGMVFLNASAQPVSGTGPFAWDRKKGRVYRVVEHRDDIEFWLFR